MMTQLFITKKMKSHLIQSRFPTQADKTKYKDCRNVHQGISYKDFEK